MKISAVEPRINNSSSCKEQILKFGFTLRDLFACTLVAALLTTYAIDFLTERKTVEWYRVSRIKIERSLRKTYPELEVLGSGSFAGSRRSAFIDDDLFIITDRENHLEVFSIMLRSVQHSVEEEGWEIDDFGGTDNSHWFRFRKNGSICTMHLWMTDS